MKKFSLLEEEVELKYELKDSLRNDIYSIIENTILLKFSSDKSVDSDVDIHGKEELVEKIKTLIDNVRINERIFTLEYVKTNVHRNFDMNWLNEQIDNLKENVDSTQIANQIKTELEQKGLKGVFGKGNGPDKVLAEGVDFAIALENMNWGIGTYVYLKNTPENQVIAKEIYNNHGGEYSQSYQQGKVLGVTSIGYKKV